MKKFLSTILSINIILIFIYIVIAFRIESKLGYALYFGSMLFVIMIEIPLISMKIVEYIDSKKSDNEKKD